MSGERTVIRIYLDKNNDVCFNLLMSKEIDDKMRMGIIGNIEIVKKQIVDMSTVDYMGDNEIGDIKNLFDGDK